MVWKLFILQHKRQELQVHNFNSLSFGVGKSPFLSGPVHLPYSTLTSSIEVFLYLATELVFPALLPQNMEHVNI